ncbi:MAG: tetratricopeptide repeat protein [Cyanobacteria bacterium P01_D01_bin.116]
MKSIPYPSITNFVGRSDVLTELHDKLQKTNTIPIYAVVGMGGIGKTQLAVNYSHQYETDYPGGICWVKARDSDFNGLAAQILQFVKLDMNLEVPQEIGGIVLDLKEQLKWCWRNWQPVEGKVLIVFDDVTDWESCYQALPTVNRFSVLITTRLRNLNRRLVDEISLDVLSPEDAKKLLIDLVGDTSRFVGKEILSKLCERLGYLPLSLQLVGTYLAKDPSLSLGKILQLLNQQGLNSDALKSTDSTQLGVKAAINLSWLKLNKQTQLVSKLLSLFAPDVIPWRLVEKVSQQLNWNLNDVKKARIQLYEFNLIQIVSSEDNFYRVHVLIRDFFNSELTSVSFWKGLQNKVSGVKTAEDLKQAFVKVMLSIARKVPQTPTRSEIESVEDAIPHLKEVAEKLIGLVEDEDLVRAFLGIAWFYEGQGLYTLAEPWLEQCLSTTKQRLGEKHPNVASSLNNLAYLYDSQGRYSEAEPLYLQALELRKELLGEKHPNVALSLNNLAGLYCSQGRYEQAAPLYLQALELRKELLGEKHPEVATSLNNLALLYNSQGRYEKAEPLYLQALELYKELLGEKHPDVALSLNNLAYLYESQGRYEQAEPLYLQALELRKELLGEKHPDVALSLNNLAGLYKSQGRYEKAEPLYLQALELYKELLGEKHHDVATSLNNLAGLYDSQGRYEKAEPLYFQALEIAEQKLGVNHPHTVIVRNNLQDLRDKRH